MNKASFIEAIFNYKCKLCTVKKNLKFIPTLLAISEGGYSKG